MQKLPVSVDPADGDVAFDVHAVVAADAGPLLLGNKGTDKSKIQVIPTVQWRQVHAERQSMDCCHPHSQGETRVQGSEAWVIGFELESMDLGRQAARHCRKRLVAEVKPRCMECTTVLGEAEAGKIAEVD